ncbi:hypothetical protein LX32DRAFT_361045 [Colletotrichum zoysiae]|uniref:Uncharacterized protein n=1 Tax=Colletotrichum zoysiae TaxID=1216348 RepID=A0AAD9HI42_9PEZI|nr:hypothetical protein LX32DRAFT_361045 [Colletotrichum zoysiae]
MPLSVSLLPQWMIRWAYPEQWVSKYLGRAGRDGEMRQVFCRQATQADERPAGKRASLPTPLPHSSWCKRQSFFFFFPLQIFLWERERRGLKPATDSWHQIWGARGPMTIVDAASTFPLPP